MENIDIFIILLSLSAFLLCGVLVAILVLISKTKGGNQNSESSSMIQEQLLNIRKTLDYKLAESNKSMTDNMSRTFATSSKISENSNKQIEEITKKLTELGETNKQIQDIGAQLRGLENVLKNPKQRGNLGEYFLKELLENVFSSDQYKLQYALSIGVVDAGLFLGGKTIPIDAKFPHENYERLTQSEDEFSIKKYSTDLKRDIKNRIDEVSKYILPEENTTDFAFMLIPAEGMYYDIFINKIGDISPTKLIEYGFSKKVIICSPSGFYAYLQTVLQGMKSLQIEEKAKEIQKYVLKLQKDISSYEEVYSKLGNSLSTTVNHFNTGKKRLEIIDKDILKINPEAQESRTSMESIDKPLLD
ncbi:DNA recombination protein RmuC [Candidatus Gracilibacteria bacterium]|nr:DNA recombination protein RmuC [Candidatus Gracilibacteria bacterium]